VPTPDNSRDPFLQTISEEKRPIYIQRIQYEQRSLGGRATVAVLNTQVVVEL